MPRAADEHAYMHAYDFAAQMHRAADAQRAVHRLRERRLRPATGHVERSVAGAHTGRMPRMFVNLPGGECARFRP